MASTNKTENIQLNQWVASDPVLREDFNADNEKIDAAIKAMGDSLSNELDGIKSGLLKVATGSYVGTGTSGSTNPNTLTFDFEPLLLIVCFDGYKIFFVKNHPNSTAVGSNQQAYNSSGYAWHTPYVTWGSNFVRWYSADTMSGSASQLNSNGTPYRYIAFGI